MTIIDILLDGTRERDEKIQITNDLMTGIFPVLEGDTTTFIGSTFMRYGEAEPYYNHCLVLGSCDNIDGIDIALTKEESVKQLHQPSDRIGDLVVTCKADYALGKGVKDHDLSQLKEPLRSHGGLDETLIPIFVSEKLNKNYKEKKQLNNYDIFDLALNYNE